jgi:hypothetical protein
MLLRLKRSQSLARATPLSQCYFPSAAIPKSISGQPASDTLQNTRMSVFQLTSGRQLVTHSVHTLLQLLDLLSLQAHGTLEESHLVVSDLLSMVPEKMPKPALEKSAVFPLVI